jgi:hypothetical protein
MCASPTSSIDPADYVCSRQLYQSGTQPKEERGGGRGFAEGAAEGRGAAPAVFASCSALPLIPRPQFELADLPMFRALAGALPGQHQRALGQL